MSWYADVFKECTNQKEHILYCYLVFIVYVMRKSNMDEGKVKSIIRVFRYVDRFYTSTYKDKEIKLDFFVTIVKGSLSEL